MRRPTSHRSRFSRAISTSGSSGITSSREACEPAPMGEHLGVGEVGVPAARVGKDEEPGLPDGLRARPAGDLPRRRSRRDRGPELAKDGDPHESGCSGSILFDLGEEGAAASLEILATEVGARPGSPGHDVRDADAVLGKPEVLLVGHAPRYQPRFEEEIPELVADPGEVMPLLGGAHPGIDPDENQVERRLEIIGEPSHDASITAIPPATWMAPATSSTASTTWPLVVT